MADTADTRIVLIRHGEANAAVEQFIGGHQSCTGLSELGRRQAEALHDRLARTGELAPVHALYASLMERSVETARIIAPALGEVEIRQDCGVCEIHPGDAEGLTWEQYREQFATEDDLRDPYVRWAPGGESWAEFSTRAGTRLRELTQEHVCKTVVVACHGGVIESSLIAFGRVPLHRGFATYVQNTSLTEWRRAEHDREWTLVRFNDAAHLADL
ncbi:MAG: histidine phosphatase family protein [Actinobacteria bacterium]|nr:histidine phosphatase family protein [Actinomycetota bacterium]